MAATRYANAMLKAHTFGKSKAAQDLAKILSENPKQIRKSQKFSSDFNHGIHQIGHIPDRGVRTAVLQGWRDRQLAHVKASVLTDEVKRFLCNVMSCHYREALKQYRRPDFSAV